MSNGQVVGASSVPARPWRDRSAWSPARVASVVAPVAAAVVVTVAVLSGVTTARGRIAASTETSSLLSAGTIDLVVDSGSGRAAHSLLFDEPGLHAGQVIERCLQVGYEGTFTTANIRLSGEHAGGTGLAPFISTRVERGTGSDPGCADFGPTDGLYDGGLSDLLATHSTFATGLMVADAAAPGERTTVRVRLEVADDNAAMDLTTRFVLVLEVRP